MAIPTILMAAMPAVVLADERWLGRATAQVRPLAVRQCDTADRPEQEAGAQRWSPSLSR